MCFLAVEVKDNLSECKKPFVLCRGYGHLRSKSQLQYSNLNKLHDWSRDPS